jgi:hypothetical protein
MTENGLYIRHDRYEQSRCKARWTAASIDPFPWVLSDVSLERAYKLHYSFFESLNVWPGYLTNRPSCIWISFQTTGTPSLSTSGIASHRFLEFVNRNPRIAKRNPVLVGRRRQGVVTTGNFWGNLHTDLLTKFRLRNGVVVQKLVLVIGLLLNLYPRLCSDVLAGREYQYQRFCGYSWW